MFSSGILPTYHASHRQQKSIYNLPGHDFTFVCRIGFSFCPRLVRSYSLAWVWGLRIFVGGVLCSSAPGSGKPAVDIYRFGFGDRYTDGWDSPYTSSTPSLHLPSHILSPTPSAYPACTLLVRLPMLPPCCAPLGVLWWPPACLCNNVAFRADVRHCLWNPYEFVIHLLPTTFHG